MIKQRSNTAVIFLLLIAFLVVKWTPAHAHLNTLHDHGDEQHQHRVETHAHQPRFFHADPIDSHHQQLVEAKVVELDHDQTQSSSKKASPPLTLISFVYYTPLIQTVEFDLTGVYHFLPRPPPSHPVQPRAPPIFLS
jgi:hypothetical protein